MKAKVVAFTFTHKYAQTHTQTAGKPFGNNTLFFFDTEMEMATKRWKVAHFTRDVLEAFMLILLVFMVGFWIRVGMSWLKAIQ